MEQRSIGAIFRGSGRRGVARPVDAKGAGADRPGQILTDDLVALLDSSNGIPQASLHVDPRALGDGGRLSVTSPEPDAARQFLGEGLHFLSHARQTRRIAPLFGFALLVSQLFEARAVGPGRLG